MTLLAVEHSARIEECAGLVTGRPWVSSYHMRNDASLVHLLYNPFECDYFLLLSAEWQQILPFLAQIGCNLELRDHNGQTPFLLAASYLNFRCIQELSKQGVDTYVRDASGKCAFDIVLSLGGRTYQDRSSDLCMTIMALLTAGCDPHTSSMWTAARKLWHGSVWNICESAFRNLGWTTQEIDELVDNSQGSSKTQDIEAFWQELSYRVSKEHSHEASPREMIVQSIEKDGSEENMDPSRSDPGPSLDRASTFTPSKKPRIRKRQEDHASLSPATDASSHTDARTPRADSGQGKDNAHDLPEPLRKLDLGPYGIVTYEQNNSVQAKWPSVDVFAQPPYVQISNGTKRYIWVCCVCSHLNNGALNPSCIGSDIFVPAQLCEHRCCKDCSVREVS